MTKEEADKRVAEARDGVVDAVRRIDRAGTSSFLAHVHCEIERALDALIAAEAARAAIDKPRLMTPGARAATECVPVKSPLIGFSEAARLIEADRADILSQAEKLPVYEAHIPKSKLPYIVRAILPDNRAILLSDLRKLITGEDT